MNKHTDLGFHAYIRGIILIGFALLMLAFIITGNIRYYIAPTMMPFTYFATVVFLLLGVVQIIRSTAKNQEEEHDCECGADHSMPGSPAGKLLVYSIFIVPIILGFVLPDKVLDSSVAANRGIQYGSGILTEQSSAPSPAQPAATNTARAEAFLADPDGYYEQLEAGSTEADEFDARDYYVEEGFKQYYEDLAEEFHQAETVIVTEENYLDVMTILDLQLQRFVGHTIEITGFVYREPDFADHQFVVARFGMTCCVADAAVYGTMVHTDDASQFANDTWVTLRGVLNQTEYNGYPMPLVQLKEIEVIEEPENPYVFPRFSF
ncbi:TIGR03943 family putative permease subunit [Halalkalibacter oceani]|uniref:TIGR03943 family protein n=1 Tax=Halalkalibacter oceani TaxID=1653776 RepID=A0A9X2DT71_9BACI|nr:TIGR03943 family protein [Halalkalibacter oceani]MCM3714853.1 TIGR03943 family protein [Halalkalibacter oceani]